MARKHKIGKRERAALEIELKELTNKIDVLCIADEDGFEPFYDDVESNSKLVDRKFEIEGILGRGFYHK